MEQKLQRVALKKVIYFIKNTRLIMGGLLSNLNKREYSVDFHPSVNFKQMKSAKKTVVINTYDCEWFSWRCGSYRKVGVKKLTC